MKIFPRMFSMRFMFSFISTCTVVIVLYWWIFGTAHSFPPKFEISIRDGDKHKLMPIRTVGNIETTVQKRPNFDDDMVVIYNRVPKTGSTSFVNLAYDLCKKNQFHVLHINVSANMHVLSLPNQVKFVRNITTWSEMKPALYHGHLAYLDFSKYSMPVKPIYINIIRKPLDRLVSYYYFLRYGDNYRPNVVRKKAGDKMSFDECVEKKQPDCDPNNMWLQIPFFCGHSAECWIPESEWALEQAKFNLANHYFLVGITEDIESFVSLLEVSLPRLFNGSSEYFLGSNKSHLRQTASKIEPKSNTVAEIKQSVVWKMENELYEFALQQFQFVKKKLTLPSKNIKQYFFYEKIRPKS